MIGKQRIIALCTCRMQDKESHNLISALETALHAMDCHLIIYNCCSLIRKGTEKTDAKLSVFSLIGSSYVDAVVILADRFDNTEACRMIADNAASMGLPVISLGHEMNGCFNIIYDDCAGFGNIVEHLIKDHGKKDLHMIAGLKGNIYSEKRIACFKDIISANGIPFDDSMISYGDFWPQPAEDSVRRLIDSGRIPEAIVCANDNMAIAVAALLNEMNISVPERVTVTGYDCIDAIYCSEPTITSAYISAESTSEAIRNALDSIFSNGTITGSVVLPSSMVYNESCGCTSSCKRNSTAELSVLHNRFCSYQDDNLELSETGSRLQKCTEFADAAAIVDKCGLMRSMSCYIRTECTDERNDLTEISKDMSGSDFLVLYDSKAADTSRSITADGLYSELSDYIGKGCNIIITALNDLDTPMGFVVFRLTGNSFSDYYRIPQIVNVLNNAFSGIINLRHKQYLMRHIDEMYRNDALTGLYNRRGFCIEYEKFLQRHKGERLSVVMCDLDGLKTINDVYGHESGDAAIFTVAQALMHACPDDALCTRMGGDEMLAVYVSEVSDDDFRSSFESFLDVFNRTSGKNYTVAASIGIYHTAPDETLSFEELIKCSDSLMYSEKKRRKQQRR